MDELFFSIIIVSWNAKHHLETFLPSVAATDYPGYEIIIADNASDDGSREWVEEHFPDVRILTLDKNYGYCGGNNRGALSASGDILLFLNNDVETPSNWLAALNNSFKADSGTAIIQPKMLSWHNKKSFEYAGASGGFLDAYGYPFCRGRLFSTVEEDTGQYDDVRPIFWASGAAFAIRKSVFEELGGFDEEFEFHMEEIDLCWRAWNRGHKVICNPGSQVYHLGGGSLPVGDPRKTFYNFRNSLFMLWKNYSGRSRFFRLPVRYLLDVSAFLQFSAKGQFREAFAICRAYCDFLKKIPSLNRKRKNGNRKRDEHGLLCPFSIVKSYFIHRIKRFSQLEGIGKIIKPS